MRMGKESRGFIIFHFEVLESYGNNFEIDFKGLGNKFVIKSGRNN
jgi:hypothetical protein